jgi:hypothetical protein
MKPGMLYLDWPMNTEVEDIGKPKFFQTIGGIVKMPEMMPPNGINNPKMLKGFKEMCSKYVTTMVK